MRLSYSRLAIVSIIALSALAACNPLNKMNKKHGLVKYSLDPNPLEMHGDSVAITVSGRYPEKFFHKKVVANVSPVMVDANGNVVKEFETIKLIGELAEGEGTKINKTGGSFNVFNIVAFESAMENVDLEIRVEAGFKTKIKSFDPVPLGHGTITTPMWVQSDEMPILGKDKFTKVSPRSISAEINYELQRSNVRSTEMKDADILDVDTFMQKGLEYEYTWKGVQITSYASPDGETSLNENLAGDRANSAASAVMSMFKKAKIDAGGEESLYSKTPKGEDWMGFKEKMEGSEIADKDMILRILGMHSDDQKREEEIKNLAATYEVIAEEILPPLRRSVITINAEEEAKTDDELKQLVKENPSELTIEEILYTATLYKDLNDKLEVYKAAQATYSDDWRSSNNVGYIYVLQNKVSEGKAEFEKAAKASPAEKVVMNNIGAVTRLMGDRSGAMDYYKKAKGAGAEVNYNIGILNIMGGDYEDAVSNMGSYNTFNSALAKMLNGSSEEAVNAIEASDAKATAEGYYLKALVGARTSNKDMIVNNLKPACDKDSALKDKAAGDAEFMDYWDDDQFKAAIAK